MEKDSSELRYYIYHMSLLFNVTQQLTSFFSDADINTIKKAINIYFMKSINITI